MQASSAQHHDTPSVGLHFNPFKPTANRIDASPVAETGELLLVRAPDYRAIALIPADGDAAVLAPIFAANGRWDEWVLVGGVPSYVHLFPASPVDHMCAAEWFRSANEAAGDMWGTPPDYNQETQDLVHAWRDPWDQAAEAVNRALQGPVAQRLLAQIRQLEAGESPSLRDDDDHDDELFDVWFAFATQPEYVERIKGQMGIAWAGALAFRAGLSCD